MKGYLYLAVAIVLEVIATLALKSSEQLTRWMPTLLMAICYLGAFYFLSLTLKTVPLGVSYAIWSGAGIVLISLSGIFLYKEIPDIPAIIGMLLIIAGVIVINVFSKMTVH